ncbi:MAG: histidinol-phosphatase HisJ family protein [Acidobacteria bacterium]|nr:histidinol-phosphatase HisJ family protein [Acidobacteriota bacterium]
MLISYHNHTTWSDGRHTIPELVAGARGAGVTELGISDHLAVTPDGRAPAWSIQLEKLDAYVEDVLRTAQNTDDLTIRLGVEVDYFPETLEESISLLRPYPFDYIIGSVHFINEFAIDLNSDPWEEISQEERNQIWQVYWNHIAAAAKSGYFDFIGHFDLPKKFKFYPDIDLTADALAALDAIAAADAALEINTSGWHKPVGEAYPGLFYLMQARLRNIPLLINADSHYSSHVTRDFETARKLASAAGYTELVRYEKRKRFTYPLESLFLNRS